jgi:hypothetical protein
LRSSSDRVAADAAGVDLDDLDLARRVHDEGAALGQAGFLDHHAEVAGDAPVGSPIIGYLILPMVSEVSCQALCVKWVSVDTA